MLKGLSEPFPLTFMFLFSVVWRVLEKVYALEHHSWVLFHKLDHEFVS